MNQNPIFARQHGVPGVPGVPGVQPEAIFLGYSDTEGAAFEDEHVALAAAREEALANAAAEEAEGEDLPSSILSDETLDAIAETATAEQWNRIGAVIFASDLSLIIEDAHDLPTNLDSILVLAKFIETGDVLP